MCRKLILVGFMASGKSTAARKLSKALNIPWYDIDTEIEKLYGPIESLWLREEKFFRRLEESVTIDILLKHEKAIVALGGGGFLNSKIRGTIKAINGLSIFLDRDFECIVRYISNTKRPLCLLSDLKQLYLKRYSYYTLADKVVKYDEEFDVLETVNSIRNFFCDPC